jgi:serine phosphatase RsbU (regulator of sigma subunit)
MPTIKLKSLLSPRSSSAAPVAALCAVLGDELGILDPAGKTVFGTASSNGSARVGIPVLHEGQYLGSVVGPDPAASALALLLTDLAARESVCRDLASEVLHLYREVNLIEQLSEELVALLNLAAVGESALAQAQRLIAATYGVVLISERPGEPLRPVAALGGSRSSDGGVIDIPDVIARCAESVVIKGLAEIVNDRDSASTISRDSMCGALLAAPLRAGQRTVGVIILANTAERAAYTAPDLKLLNTIALQTATAIENALLCADMVEAVRDREKLAALQNELDTARTIQHLLVPRTFPPFPERTDFDIHAQMNSARAVGGDFFDFFLIDEDRIGLVMGDVSGKGIPAALYMAVTRTQIKTTALHDISPAECLSDVNRFLVRESVGSMFATCFYGLLHLRTGELQYCSAGHNPAYVLRTGARSVEPLAEVGGIPLGLFDGMGYIGSTTILHPGDALFLYTDGVPEAQNIAGEDFTDERLVQKLHASVNLTCKELIDHLASEIYSFTAGAAQSDDITMLSIRRMA